MSADLDDKQRANLARQLAELRDRNHSVADLGQAVLDYALTEAATSGTLADGVLEVPVTITLRISSADENFAAPLTCVEACVKGGSTKRLCAWICNPSPVIEPRTIQ